MWGSDARSGITAIVMSAALTLCVACGSDATNGASGEGCTVAPSETPVVSGVHDSSIVANDRLASYLTADAHGVYWGASDGLLRMLAHGSTSPQTLFQSTREVTGVSVDEAAIYFNGGLDDSYSMGLFRLERAGPPPQALAGFSIESSSGSWGPFLDGERLYFMNNSDHIASIPKLGGDPVDTVIDSSHLHGFAVDETHLYWLESSKDGSNLKRVPKAGGQQELLASGLKFTSLPPLEVAPQVVGDSVLFVRESGLLAVPKTGGCPRALIWHEDHRVMGFVVDSDQIYYKRVASSDSSQSSILRVPLAGGEAVELLQRGPRGDRPAFAVHADKLYWASFDAVYVLEL